MQQLIRPHTYLILPSSFPHPSFFPHSSLILPLSFPHPSLILHSFFPHSSLILLLSFTHPSLDLAFLHPSHPFLILNLPLSFPHPSLTLPSPLRDSAWLVSCRVLAIISLILQLVGIVLVILLLLWILCKWFCCDARRDCCDRCLMYAAPIIWILSGTPSQFCNSQGSKYTVAI
jgi:hypothetical protein